MLKKFIGRLSFFAIIIVVSIIIIGLLPGDAAINVFVDKQEQFRVEEGPRIIFVGGSGLLYSINSSCIENNIKRNVVNTGLHAGLGLPFILDHARPYIKSGDIIILAPEYGLLTRGYNFGDAVIASLVFTDIRDKPSYLFPTDYYHGLLGFPSVAYNKIIVRPLNNLRLSLNPFRYPKPYYWRKDFEVHGDLILSPEDTKTLAPSALDTYPKAVIGDTDISIQMINNFADYASSRGAKVFLAFTPVVDVRYDTYKDTFLTFYKKLITGLKIPTIGHPSNYVYPISYFYDTPEHIVRKARKIRTEQLLYDMKQSIPDVLNFPENIIACSE